MKAAGVTPEKEAASPATPSFKDAHTSSVSSSFKDSNCSARKTNLSTNGMSFRIKPELAYPLNQAPADVIDIGDHGECPTDNGAILKLKQENDGLRLRYQQILLFYMTYV